MESEYIIGIGCRRGVSSSEIESAVSDILLMNSIKKESVKSIASVNIKSDEKGLLEFAEKWNLEIDFFTKKQLATVQVPNPSQTVLKKIGTVSVCEAAAIFAGKQDPTHLSELIAEKQKFSAVTVAVVEIKGKKQL